MPCARLSGILEEYVDNLVCNRKDEMGPDIKSLGSALPSAPYYVYTLRLNPWLERMTSKRVTYVSLWLLRVAKIRRLAACAFTRPTTLPARSGTRVASIKLASRRVLALSEALRGALSLFIWPSGHIESVRSLRYRSTASSWISNL